MEFGENKEKFGENKEKFGENKTREKIIDVMLQKPTASAKTIGEEIGITTRGVEKSIRHLKELGIIERIGPAKGGYWTVIKQQKQE
jgi:ATP-dependent DNA helicase RecG